MSARTRLVTRPEYIHRLGIEGGYSLDQLPAPEIFSNFHEEDPAAIRCGFALAESFFKLLRPEPDQGGLEIDSSFGWLREYCERIADYSVHMGFLAHVESLLQMALMYPERLPTLCRRLDALDNANLALNLASALGHEPIGGPHGYGGDGGIFAGLTSGGDDGR